MDYKDENLVEAIDTLAAEYGWTIEYIQKLEIEEITQLMAAIKKRKVTEYKILGYVINCGVNGRPVVFEDDKESSLPEDEQLIALMNKIGGEVKKR